MEPERQPELRASDIDRERVLARLRDAHAEGRLDVNDFYERLDAVYNARTYGELDVLTRDLPVTAAAHSAPPAPRAIPQRIPPAPAVKSTFDQLPAPLRAGWLAWMSAVLINVIIWASVSAGTGELHYFWPMWVGGPWGSVLLALTLVWYVSRRDGKPPR